MASYPLGTYGDLLAHNSVKGVPLAMDPALSRVSVSDVLHSDIAALSGMINQKMLDKPRTAEAMTPIMAVAASHTVGRSQGSAVFPTRKPSMSMQPLPAQ